MKLVICRNCSALQRMNFCGWVILRKDKFQLIRSNRYCQVVAIINESRSRKKQNSDENLTKSTAVENKCISTTTMSLELSQAHDLQICMLPLSLTIDFLKLNFHAMFRNLGSDVTFQIYFCSGRVQQHNGMSETAAYQQHHFQHVHEYVRYIDTVWWNGQHNRGGTFLPSLSFWRNVGKDRRESEILFFFL